MKKFFQIALLLLMVIIQFAFFALIVATYIPLPRYFSVISVPFLMIALIVFVLPNITLLVVEYSGIKRQAIAQSVCGICALIIVICVQIIVVPALLGEAIASYTNNADNYGKFDGIVQAEYDAVSCFPHDISRLTNQEYCYLYHPEFGIWIVYAEFRWEEAGAYKQEKERLESIPTENFENWQGCQQKSLHPVTTAYELEDDEKTIRYFVCDGVGTFLSRLHLAERIL